MARRKNEQNSTPRRPAMTRLSVLVVSPCRERREAMVARVQKLGGHAVAACDTMTGVAMLHSSVYDAALVDAGSAMASVCALTAAQHSLTCVLVAEAPDFAMAVESMRAGASDLIDLNADDERLAASLVEAGRRSRVLRAKERLDQRRTRKLRAACRELSKSREALMNQLGTVCTDMAGACRDLTGQMKQVALAAELNTIFRQELDLESLLRTVLEYTLKKVGSTNAAIFLPGSTGDFTLGAYVNYDCPRDTAETLLDHLADIIAPAFEHRDDIAVMKGLGSIRAEPGTGGEWLEDSSVTAFACRVDGECLAVVVLFRDRRTPFTPASVQTVRVIRDLFAQQLSRVIRTHHRHLPKHQWGGFFGEKSGPDDVDLAA